MISAFCWPPAVPLLSDPQESHCQAGLAGILSDYRQYCISERKGMSVSTLKRQGRCQFASPPHCNLQHFRPPPASSLSNMWHHCTSAFLSPIFFWQSPLLLCCWVAGWATFTKWATYAAEHLQDPQPLYGETQIQIKMHTQIQIQIQMVLQIQTYATEHLQDQQPISTLTSTSLL